uniref:Uncharacterized protein n=1 Tax=mine drainage metagenome TaxID=410659 RepID=E6PML2_9ZZZZ
MACTARVVASSSPSAKQQARNDRGARFLRLDPEKPVHETGFFMLALFSFRPRVNPRT